MEYMVSVYTLWASLTSDGCDGSWMIAAEDEFCWEGDPVRCGDVFSAARELAKKNDWQVREITLKVPSSQLEHAWRIPEIDVVAESSE